MLSDFALFFHVTTRIMHGLVPRLPYIRHGYHNEEQLMFLDVFSLALALPLPSFFFLLLAPLTYTNRNQEKYSTLFSNYLTHVVQKKKRACN
jgi:hypothetical protein